MAGLPKTSNLNGCLKISAKIAGLPKTINQNGRAAKNSKLSPAISTDVFRQPGH
jgi:hypothetical protein